MKKNYVYKLCKSGIVCTDLNSAVSQAVEDIRQEKYDGCAKLSTPLVSKVQGGYQVVVVDAYGEISYRGIDVFTPKQHANKKFYMDRTFHFVKQPKQDEQAKVEQYESPKQVYTAVECANCGELIEGNKATYVDDMPYCSVDCVCDDLGVVHQCVSCRLFQDGECDGACSIEEYDD